MIKCNVAVTFVLQPRFNNTVMKNSKYILFLLLMTQMSVFAQSNVIKSPYLIGKEIWSIATVKDGLPLRERFDYNCEKQRMEFLDQYNLNLELVDIANIDTIFLGNHKMIPYQNRFLEIYYKSPSYELKVDYKLSAANRGKMNRGMGIKTQANGIETIDLQSMGHVPQEGRYSNIEAWEYIPRHTYHLAIGKKTKLFKDKKSLLKLFPDKRERIEKSINDLKVDFSNPAEVNELLQSIIN